MNDPQGGHGVEAAGAHRAAPGGEVGERHLGVKARGGAHQQRRRPRVEPQPVDHDESQGRPRRGRVAPALLRRARRRRRQVRGLGRQTAAGLSGHLVEGTAEARRHSGGHGALDQRRFAEQDAVAPLRRQQVEGHLRREHGAAEVHEHKDAVGRPRLRDGPRHGHDVGAQRTAGPFESAGGRDVQVRPAHLGRELGHAGGELRAVANQHQSDQGTVPAGSEVAAVSRSNHDDVAPGS